MLLLAFFPPEKKNAEIGVQTPKVSMFFVTSTYILWLSLPVAALEATWHNEGVIAVR